MTNAESGGSTSTRHIQTSGLRRPSTEPRMVKLFLLAIISVVSCANAVLLLVPDLPGVVVLVHLIVAAVLPFAAAMTVLFRQDRP